MTKIKSSIILFGIIFFIGFLSSCDNTKKLNSSTPLPILAEKPPMGWNSYMCFANDVNEEQVKANADYMAENLKEFGWEYVVIDVDWYKTYDSTEVRGGEPTLDEYGRFWPDTTKFPSAKNGSGFKPLADYIHSKGLKFGIHIMRGVPAIAAKQQMKILGTNYTADDIAEPNNMCDWNRTMLGINMTHPAGSAYIQSVIDLYAEWDIDYIKADDMTARLYQVDEITAIGTAIKKAKRGIVFSLSPGPTPLGVVNHIRQNAHLWRVCNDYWDTWADLKEQFGLCAPWAPYITKNNWPDADMLPIGKLRKTGVGKWEANKLQTTPEDATDEYSRFTEEEQITMMNLWSIFRSPLMIGGNLPENDDFTLSLLTNKALLEINQASTNNKVIYHNEHKSIWTADSENGKYTYLAIFNLSDEIMNDNLLLERIGLKDNRKYKVEDIWNKDQQTVTGKISVTLQQHASVLYRIEI